MNQKSILVFTAIICVLFISVTAMAQPVENAELALTGGTTTRVSVASDGTQGNYPSASPSISGDGRYIAFESYADNLVSDDTNNQEDIFVHDLQTGETKRVSIASNGMQGTNESEWPSISTDGRYVAFHSGASNLVSDDTNNRTDIFIHDLQTEETTRISLASDGTQGNLGSWNPSTSTDGHYISFVSPADNLVDDDTNGVADIFVHDRQTGTTTRLSLASDGTQGDSHSYDPSISADGRYVAFSSVASNLVSDDTNDTGDIFVHDQQAGETTRVSLSSDGTQGNDNGSSKPSISADGRYVAFHSGSNNLVSDDTNGVTDIFVHDRQTGETTRVSVASDGTQGNDYSLESSIFTDGRYVSFYSYADNLVSNDTNGVADIFVHDRQTGTTTRLSLASDGTQGDSHSYDPSISADGRYVAFHSGSNNLVSDDTNGVADIFIHDQGTESTPNCNDTEDTDGDGLLNGWELCGYDHDGDGDIDVDLPAMGAAPLHKDIFLEIDYMVDDGWCVFGVCTSGHTHQPKKKAIADLQLAFAVAPVSNPDGTTGIHLHVDYGSDAPLLWGNSTTWGSLSRADELVHETPFSRFNWDYFDDMKRLEVVREPIFHYAIMIHDLGIWSSGGLSRNYDGNADDALFRYGASDFVIGLHNAPTTNEAVIIMHELGHNLGLRHGGDDHAEYEPNYLSVMNYSFEFGLIIGEREGYLDYSRFSTATIPVLDENNLDEIQGLGGASEIENHGTRYYCGFFSNEKTIMHVNDPIDWDCSGQADNSSTDEDINKSGEWSDNIRGINDWDILVYDGGSIGRNNNASVHPYQNDVSIPRNMNLSSLQTEPEPFSHIQPLYTVDLTQSAFYALEKDIQATLPFTMTNSGYMTTTIMITVTADSWLDATAIPNMLTLAPEEVVTFTIGINADALGSGTIGNVGISTKIIESERMVNEAIFTFRVGPKARFTDYSQEDYPSKEIHFTDLSVGQISSWLWDFGDAATSAEQNPTHIYDALGTYTVSLTVTGADGSDSYTRTITVKEVIDTNQLFLPIIVK